jgi:NAD(P)-dependent dehydrogenase (short-subunit alcohol dehydrogenase family)
MAANKPTWFITGASSGFGMAFARYALEQGYNVVATARTPSKLEGLAAVAPDRLLVHALDVTVRGDAEKAVEAAVKRFGRIDVLINNAGYGIVGALEETPEEELRAQMETNFFGAVAVTRAVLPVMRNQRSGAVVNISSLGGQLSFGGFSAYSASKFALEGMSEALAQEVAPFGIKVLIVEPGAFRTGFAADALKHMPIMDAYRDVVGGTREFAHGMHGTQEGDPAKAAAAIDTALRSANTPLRLQLGADAVAAVRTHSENLLKDLAAWENVALETRLAPSAAPL